MTDEQAFLEAICANPEDDTPRLVYADWLTERDQPGDSERAELIRVQCWLAQWQESLGKDCVEGHPQLACGQPCAVCTHRWRQKELLAQSWREPWEDAAFPFWRQLPVFGATWRRGFVEDLRLYASDWCQYGDAIRAATPLRQVTLTGRLTIAWELGQEEVQLYPHVTHSQPFQTLPRATWDRLTENKNLRSRNPGWGWLAQYLWPGLVFDGPDFPEQTFMVEPDDKGILA